MSLADIVKEWRGMRLADAVSVVRRDLGSLDGTAGELHSILTGSLLAKLLVAATVVLLVRCFLRRGSRRPLEDLVAYVLLPLSLVWALHGSLPLWLAQAASAVLPPTLAGAVTGAAPAKLALVVALLSVGRSLSRLGPSWPPLAATVAYSLLPVALVIGVHGSRVGAGLAAVSLLLMLRDLARRGRAGLLLEEMVAFALVCLALLLGSHLPGSPDVPIWSLHGPLFSGLSLAGAIVLVGCALPSRAGASRPSEDEVARALLPLAMLGSLWLNYQGLTQFILPTYGNTMYQLAFSRFTMEHGERTPLALEYGGLSRNYYVPGFRMLVAVMALALAQDVVPAAQVFMFVSALAFPLLFYSVGRRLSGRSLGGLAVALMFLTAPELQIYVVRPLPELLGLFFIPLVVYAATLSEALVVLFAYMVGMTHPQSMASVCFTLGVAAVVHGHSALRDILFLRRRPRWRELALLVGTALLVGGSYLAWHRLQAGTFSMDVLAPVRFKEFGKALELGDFLGAGEFVFAFGLVGAYLLLLDTRPASTRGRVIVLAWVAATLLLTKNELLGVRSHTERFLAFLQESLVVTSGLGVHYLWRMLDAVDLGLAPERPAPEREGHRHT